MEEEDLLEYLVASLLAGMPGEVVSLSVHGDWAIGEFRPHRSQLNLLAVTQAEPDDEIEARLRVIHAEGEALFANWREQVECEYLGRQGCQDFDQRPRSMLRAAPGEILHRVNIDDLAVLRIYAAREHGVPLLGEDPKSVLPQISQDQLRASVRAHLKNWPAFTREHTSTRSQAYAVLTMSRALYSLRRGELANKREAAAFAQAELPQRADLIAWAEDWWFNDGERDAPGRLAEVFDYVDEIAALADAEA